MTNPLLDPIRHNSWATGGLLAFCRDLDARQLAATAPGTYGSVLSTLQHFIGAEGRYLRTLSGFSPDWPREPEDTEDLMELTSMAEDRAALWEQVLADEVDPERFVSWTSTGTGARNQARVGVILAQTLNHGNEHRAQISTVLSNIGIEPPQLDGWHYAMVTGRFSSTPRRQPL